MLCGWLLALRYKKKFKKHRAFDPVTMRKESPATQRLMEQQEDASSSSMIGGRGSSAAISSSPQGIKA